MNDMPCPCTRDCPDRNGYECKLTCKKLKEYEEIHFKFLQEKLKEKNTRMEYISYKKKKIAKTKRRKKK